MILEKNKMKKKFEKKMKKLVPVATGRFSP